MMYGRDQNEDAGQLLKKNRDRNERSENSEKRGRSNRGAKSSRS
jgi:hypothetical protein